MGTRLPTGIKSPSLTGSFKINNQISYWQNLSFYAYAVEMKQNLELLGSH